MSIIAFSDADKIADDFLSLLHKHAISPPESTKIEDELLSVTRLLDVWKEPTLRTGIDQSQVLRAASGVVDLAAKVLACEPLADFIEFIPHLRLIAETKIRTASIGQNQKGEFGDDTGRKMAELYIACLAVHCGSSIKLDHPVNSKGDNPDLILTVDEAGRNSEKWAFAIKTVSSTRGQTIFERIEEGAKQINSPRCSADHGVVIINAKDALDHEKLWHPVTPFNSEGDAMNALKSQLASLAENANENRPQEDWDAIFTRRVVRPVLFMGQTIVSLPIQSGGRVATPLRMLFMYGANGSVDQRAHALAYSMNHYMQTIMDGVPSDGGSSPH
ncbi:hypothetical protein [Cupriavidus pauculus]|uniref:hypothetical protein n=1 Tax=Cupriavidus pauculus TaxID=82633 RepID=UPI00078302A5|nr:hypothetical protein [Cupriavidus pauculus]